jgi:EAL domain-containing protein (putative c-di-GMP-specific phosphodiesterase class I)/GGDEF domain-containing protein
MTTSLHSCTPSSTPSAAGSPVRDEDARLHLDGLTGLLSGRAFRRTLDRWERGAVAVFDLDHLVSSNAALGHAAGDEVLRRAALVLSVTAGSRATLGRVGDGRLAVAVPEPDAIAVHTLASQVLAQVRSEVACWRGACAGISTWHAQGSAEAALATATLAAHDAGRESGAPVRYAEMETESDPMQWITRLRDALSADQLILQAQPILDVRSGATVRHELLLRLRGDEGLVLPQAFLPAAERFGLVRDLDLWVARWALALAAAGHAVSMNVSAHTLGDERMLALVDKALAARPAPVAPMIEISERALASRRDREALTFLQRLSRRGCLIALDNFGSAGSSLTPLRDLPVDVLKLDRELVEDARPESRGRSVLDGLVALAQRMEIETVAQSVGHESMPVLREAGVTYAQGFALGGPVHLSVAGLALSARQAP